MTTNENLLKWIVVGLIITAFVVLIGIDIWLLTKLETMKVKNQTLAIDLANAIKANHIDREMATHVRRENWSQRAPQRANGASEGVSVPPSQALLLPTGPIEKDPPKNSIRHSNTPAWMSEITTMGSPIMTAEDNHRGRHAAKEDAA